MTMQLDFSNMFLDAATFISDELYKIIFLLGFMTGPTEFSHVIFPGAGSMMSSFGNRWSSSDTFWLVR